MIISHKYKFIFIKTQKTAGTSIEISLSRYCGKEDVITPISLEDEKIRKKLNVFPQNYLKSSHYLVDENLYPEKDDKKKYWNHTPATHIKEQVGEKIWNSYFKFCFERNPWDKVVSLYFFITNRENTKKISFNEFLLNTSSFDCYNFPQYTHNDSVIVDFIGKYENLQNDLKNVCKKIGLDFDGWLPQAKGNYRTEKKHYSEYYNIQSIERIASQFRKEVELFGYKFEKP